MTWTFREASPTDVVVRDRHGGQSGSSGGAADPMAINHGWHTRNFAEFVAAVAAGRRPLLDGLEGRKAVAIVEACYRSARSGRTVRVADPPAEAMSRP